MKISIIIPIYNVAPYIKRCLDSVAAQTFTGDIECILVDDCGKDDSMTIARQWIKNYSGRISFVILCHTHNQGLSAARNTGIEVASGDYIYFLDSDDAITPDCIEILADLAVKYPDADLITGNTVTNAEGIMHHHFRTLAPDCVTNQEQIDYALLSATIDTAWNRLVKRHFLIQHALTFPIGIVHEDVCWLYFLAKHTQKVAFTNKGTYYYYHNEQSIMNSKAVLKKRISSYGVIAEKIFEDLKQNGATSKYQLHYFADLIVNHIQLLCTCHSLREWSLFWSRLMRMARKACTKATVYRGLFFLCTLPPLCLLCKFRWWRWRIRNYIIAKI